MGGMDDLYREQILEHHRRPHNQAPLAAPSVSLEGRNPNCGDVINLQLQLDEAGVITDVAFSGRGCAISQAGTSLITDELRGKRIDEILALGSPFVMELLGVEVGPTRIHCAQPLHEQLELSSSARVSVAPYTTHEDLDALFAGLRDARKVFEG